MTRRRAEPVPTHAEWHRCLTAWLTALPPSDLDASAWASIYLALDGQRTALERLSRSVDLPRPVEQFRRRETLRRQYVLDLLFFDDAWRHLWSGIAVHPAATGWLAHLLSAARDSLLSKFLGHHYLAALSARLLADYQSSEHTALPYERRLSQQRLDALRSTEGRLVRVLPQAGASTKLDVAWLGWLGIELVGADVADAAFQSAVSRWSPIVVKPAEFGDYVLFQPSRFLDCAIFGQDLISERSMRLVRSAIARTGWSLEVAT